MIVLDSSIMLTDVLSGWGLHELRKYPGIQVPSDANQRAALGVEMLLRHVPGLVARILLAQPLDPDEPRAVFTAEFGTNELELFRLHSGIGLTEWPGDDYVQYLIKNPDPTPIVCTVQVDRDDTDAFVGPFTIFDGWHRAKAWLVSGGPYPFIAKVIKAKGPLVGLFSLHGGRTILEA